MGDRIQAAKRHHESPHKIEAHKSLPGQTSMEQFATKTTKSKILSKKEKADLVGQAAKWISRSGLPLSFVEKEETREFLEYHVSNTLNFSEATARQVCTISRRSIYDEMEKNAKRMKTEIIKNGEHLAKSGRLYLMTDHWTCNRSSSEFENSFHGLLLTERIPVIDHITLYDFRRPRKSRMK